MKKNQVVICGYYGKGNAGDEALLMSLLQMLPSELSPVVLSANPSETSARYGVKSCYNRSYAEILDVFRSSGAFIWGGGSLMQDVTSLASPLYYASLMGLAQKMGLKTIAWAQGIGPLNHPLTRWITKQVLSGCSKISVRDQASAQLLANWKISSSIAPDPVWALAAKPVPNLVKIPHPSLAVCLRPHPLLTEQRLQWLTEGLRELQTVTNTSILLIPFQVTQDQAIAESIASQLRGPCQIVSRDNPQELKGLFRSVTMVIGMRYHSLIMAAAEGCHCFAIDYDPKVTCLKQQLNLGGWQLTEIPENIQLISHIWLNEYTKRESLPKINIESYIQQAKIHQQILEESLL
jgi:polysaccharide pyruvyl transferase CsaB